jgi:hypothetical protein
MWSAVQWCFGVSTMQRRMMVGIAIAALIVVKASSARSQEAVQDLATVEVAAPIYAYGPEAAEQPNIRPRYDRRYGDRRPPYRQFALPRSGRPQYGERQRYRSGQAYGGNRYDGYQSNRRYGAWSGRRQLYAGRGFDRSPPYNSYRPRRNTDEGQYAGRMITPQFRGQWRDLGPIQHSKAF